MRADDVIATLDPAQAASGPDRVTVAQRPRLLSDQGASSPCSSDAKGAGAGQSPTAACSTTLKPRNLYL
ncbi:MAG: hypothetical protein U1E62_25495 [Alsobacter sp.]